MKNQSFATRLSFAINGIRDALARERSLRTQAWCALAMVAVLAWLRPPALWWALCSLSAGLVLALELLNTALERTLDRLHPDLHDSIRAAKDCAAGAVLCASIAAACVGALTVAVGLHWI